MPAGRTRALVMTGVLATAAVVLAANIRNHPVDTGFESLALALPPVQATIDAADLELQAEEMQQLAAVAPMEPASGDAVDAASAPRTPGPVAVVAASAAPATVRKVIVGKGKRVVRHVPVAPAKPVDEVPATRTARFDMSQNGKRMTADEFDAWMKAQGIRVATGVAKPAAPAAPPAPPAACTPQPDKAC